MWRHTLTHRHALVQCLQRMLGAPAQGLPTLTSRQSTVGSSSQPYTSKAPRAFVKLVAEISSRGASPWIADAVLDAFTAALPHGGPFDVLQSAHVTFTDTGKPVPRWTRRRLGKRDITACISIKRKELQQPTASLVEQRLDWRVLTSITLRVLNATAQILLHIRINRPFHLSVSTWFITMYNDKKTIKTVSTLAEALGMDDVKEVATQADELITERNRLIHPESLSNLDEEVHELLTTIESEPWLKDTLGWEYKVLTAYENIKRAFPDRFS